MRHVVPGDNSKTCSTALDIITHLLNHPKNSEYAKQVGYAASLRAVCDSTSSLFPRAAGATQNTNTPHGTPHGNGRSDKVVALASECLSKIGVLFALPASGPFVEHLVRQILRCGRYVYIHTYMDMYICIYVYE